MKTKQKLYIALSFALVLTLSFSCGSQDSEQTEVVTDIKDDRFIEVSAEQFNTMKMAWGELDSGEFAESITVQGSVQVPVESMQEVTTFYGGNVSGMELLEGQEVRQGEILFYLENPEFILLQQNYLEVKSQLTYLKTEFERQKTLFDEQIASQKNYLKAEADYQSTRAKAESLKRQLALLRINTDELQPESIRSKIPIYSPISGFVTHIYAVPGAFVQPREVAVSLISKEHLHMELMVYEKDAGTIQKGQKVEIRIPEVSQEVMIAEVFMVGQVINEARQINVHAHLNDESRESLLVPGMFLEAEIQKNPKSGLALPKTAVIELGSNQYVLVLRQKTGSDFTLEKIEIKTGGSNGELVEILPNTELKQADQILVKGGFNLL